jgi:GrpB-like predicted nucleotidyltransferase (UPF0157 family)
VADVEVVPYDESWPVRAEAAIAEIRSALAGLPLEIEHIGSTAVPGLAAKPIIDLMAAAPALDDVAARAGDLARIGFTAADNGMPGRLVTAAGWPERNQRLLRDHLREHPEDVRRYAELKRRLAGGGLGADAYTRAKTDLIQELTDRARAARGLPPVPVWES